MKIIVWIEGREAIPIRAIPLATNWESLSPDVLAGVLAKSDEHAVSFRGLLAHRCDEGRVVPIRPAWWENFPCRALDALHEQLRAREAAGTMTREEGYQHWRQASLPLLPPGAFVWRDEFEPRYHARYGSGGRSWVAQPYDGDEADDEPPRLLVPDAERDARLVLDFDPFIHSPELRRLVMEGFEVPSVAQTEAKGARRAAGDGGRVWTEEFKEEVGAYRLKHGLRKTAAYYGVSETTISKHIPAGEKKKKKTPGPWGGL